MNTNKKRNKEREKKKQKRDTKQNYFFVKTFIILKHKYFRHYFFRFKKIKLFFAFLNRRSHFQKSLDEENLNPSHNYQDASLDQRPQQDTLIDIFDRVSVIMLRRRKKIVNIPHVVVNFPAQSQNLRLDGVHSLLGGNGGMDALANVEADPLRRPLCHLVREAELEATVLGVAAELVLAGRGECPLLNGDARGVEDFDVEIELAAGGDLEAEGDGNVLLDLFGDAELISSRNLCGHGFYLGRRRRC